MFRRLCKVTGLEVYETSLAVEGERVFFLARRGGEKLVGCLGEPCLPQAERLGELAGREVFVGPCNHANAVALRRTLAWLAPEPLGLAASAGLGDRLGLATPGHIRAARKHARGLAVVLAQQSIREMNRTGRTPDDVMDSATYGALQEHFTDGFGADADHLQEPEDIEATAAAGFTMFTIDPGSHVANEADEMDAAALGRRFDELDFAALETTAAELRGRYAGRTFPLAGGRSVSFDERTLLRAAVKYAPAVAHTAAMYRVLAGKVGGPFELEVSVDETDTPTSPAEHFFFATELRRLGVRWVSMAPRFIGRFEKGVDYIGDIDEFRASFAEHVAVMRTLGPYKISIHSGSDKFSIYPIIAELAGGLVHLKTAGTSYLEALRVIAAARPEFFREIYEFARGRYETDRRTYHVSADLAKVPPAEQLADEQLPALLDDFHARQVLHVTFGSVLTADGGRRFGERLRSALDENEEAYCAALAGHIGRHLAPFAAS
ncbi:MAG: tagaturonate epimerase family protein [Planctomycetes bacterium]|nr:tagaturonate epimerase family protein [Planctomycetota bacterium]